MPVYNAPLSEIDPKETRRYAGLMRSQDFDEKKILDASLAALLLAEPKSIWQIFPYDAAKGVVLTAPPLVLTGNSIRQHLATAREVILLAATVGKAIEEEASRLFGAGEYTASILLEAAATAAVEQTADAAERSMTDYKRRKGLVSRFRFSPGYGDFPLEMQPELLKFSEAEKIGISLTESLMLLPRKSITAIIGLCPGEAEGTAATPCSRCGRSDCLARR